MKSSGIGGQAVIEGVMMKNRGKYAIAIRKPNGEIEVDVKSCVDGNKRNIFFRLPIIRGVMAFIDSLTLGMGSLQYSASFYDEEEGDVDLDKRLNIKEGKKNKVFDIMTIVLSVIMALVIFVLVPMLITSFIAPYLTFENSRLVISLIEGLLRVTIFVIYILTISSIEDIKRMFMYHGAEHKCINCIEHGRSLTVDNVRRSSKEHKRCGTSFMLNVMILSILVFMFIDVENIALKLVLRLLLIPVIAGLSYEFSRIAGNTDNRVVNFLSKPGLLMQSLTTKEPDDSMIEVGIASVEAVFDWEPFVEELKNERRAATKSVRSTSLNDIENNTADKKNFDQYRNGNKKNNKNNSKSGKRSNYSYQQHEEIKDDEDITEQVNSVRSPQVVNDRVIAPISEEAFKPLEVDISDLFDIKLPENYDTTKKLFGKNRKGTMEAGSEYIKRSEQAEKEADELLNALDVMFEYSGAKTVTEMSDDPAVTHGDNIVFNFDSEAVQHAQDVIDMSASAK